MKKKFLLVICAVLFLSFISGCTKDDNTGNNEPTGPVEISNVVVSEKALVLRPNEKYQLNPTIEPSNATDKTINYFSGDDAVATIDDSGLITAKAEGKTNIIVIAGKWKVTVELTVSENKTGNESGNTGNTGNTGNNSGGKPTLTLHSHNYALSVGEQTTISYELQSSSVKTPTFSSQDTTVAKVASDGTITAVGEGKTQIIVTAGDAKDVISLTVTQSTANAVIYVNDQMNVDKAYWPTLELYQDGTFILRENIYSGMADYYGTYEDTGSKITMKVKGSRYNNIESEPELTTIKFNRSSSSGNLYCQTDVFMTRKGDYFIKDYEKKVPIQTFTYSESTTKETPQIVVYSDHSFKFTEANGTGKVVYRGYYEIFDDSYQFSNGVADSQYNMPDLQTFSMTLTSEGHLLLNTNIIESKSGAVFKKWGS